jgi:hypothetical protein
VAADVFVIRKAVEADANLRKLGIHSRAQRARRLIQTEA